MRTSLAIVLAGAIVVLAMGCNEDSKVVGPKGLATVMGQVYIWNCEVGYGYNNPPHRDYRFTSQTGKTASVMLVNTNSGKSLSTTSDLDGFAAILDTGTYDIVIETGFTYPDTLRAIQIGRDTVLDLNIIYRWHLADSMFAVFTWWPPSDSMGEISERRILDSVSAIVGSGMLRPDGAPRQVRFWSDSTAVTITYVVPLTPEIPKWVAVNRQREVKAIYEAIAPELFYLDAGYYICLAEH